MIPKKVRKILSIMIAVALVMAVIPAVAFADEVNTLFGNGDETVASTGDATESEEGEQEAAAIGQDENAPQSDETIATDETGAENVADTQPEDAAQTDTTVELAKIRSNGGNLDSLTGLRGDGNVTGNDEVDINDIVITIDSSNCDTTVRDMHDGEYKNEPAYYKHATTTKKPSVTITYKDSSELPTGYTSKVNDTDCGDGVYLLFVEILKDGSRVKESHIYYHYVDGPNQQLKFHLNLDIPHGIYTTPLYGNVNWGQRYNTYLTPEWTVPCATFGGWYTNPDCTGQPFDLKNTVIEQPYDLYAKWTFSHTGEIKKSEAVPAQCEENGTEEYWQCSNCGRLYSDSNLTKEITAPAVIDAVGHKWNAPSYQWFDDNTIKANRVCSNNISHIESEDGTVTSEVTQKATCSVPEETTYTATFTNPVFATQTKTVTSGDIDPNAHDWGEVTYKWANDNSSVTAIRTCKNNIKHSETETVQTTKTVTKEATETAPGDAIYYAEFSNPAFAKQSKYAEIPATGSQKEEVVDDDAYYINASGDKITWTVGSNETLNIKFERSEDNASTSKHFLGIEVDGKATSKDLYDTEDGSIIIKLKPALLETLGEGEHTLTALFDDGSASAKFTIIKATKEVKNEKKTTSKNAKTGDASPIKLVIIIMIVSALACAGVLVIKKKRH